MRARAALRQTRSRRPARARRALRHAGLAPALAPSRIDFAKCQEVVAIESTSRHPSDGAQSVPGTTVPGTDCPAQTKPSGTTTTSATQRQRAVLGRPQNPCQEVVASSRDNLQAPRSE